MKQRAVVAGTGFEGRAEIIRQYCKDGGKAALKRQPNNRHDKNAIAVYIMVPRMGGLFGHAHKQIGFIKKHTARSLSKKMDAGVQIEATINRLFIKTTVYQEYDSEGQQDYDDHEEKTVLREHPKVVLDLTY